MAKRFSGLLVAPGAKINGSVLLGNGVNIWYYAEISGEDGEVVIGADTNIQDHARILGPTRIGQACTIGHRAQLDNCIIGDNTLIGIGATIMKNVNIGSDCIIGAGACVFPGLNIPDRSMVLGNPAKVVRPVTEEEINGNLEYIRKYDINIQEYLEGHIME